MTKEERELTSMATCHDTKPLGERLAKRLFHLEEDGKDVWIRMKRKT